MRRIAIPLLLALLLGAATVAVARQERQPGQVAPYDVEFVPRAAALRWLSLGHPTLAANLYWLRTVQYLGDPRADARGWEKLYPLLDLVTDLDPRHGYAYQVGGNVLAGVGRVDESNRLLEKGMRNVPERYILPFHRAVNAFLYQGDYAEAGRWFERAASVPGAPPHLREYVVAMYVKGDDADAAVGFLTHLLESLHDPDSRAGVEKQLQQARLEQAARRIDAAVERYADRFGRRPPSVEALRAAGLLESVPADPYGGGWTIDGEGRAHSTVNPRRLKRPATSLERYRVVHGLEQQMKGSRGP